MSTRTNALLPQRETGKMAASIVPCYGRLAPARASKERSTPNEGSSATSRTLMTPALHVVGAGMTSVPI